MNKNASWKKKTSKPRSENREQIDLELLKIIVPEKS